MTAAAEEIVRLARRRVDGETDYQSADWCEHQKAARFKVECVRCVDEIIQTDEGGSDDSEEGSDDGGGEP